MKGRKNSKRTSLETKGKRPQVRKVKPTADRDLLRREFYEGVDLQLWDLRETIRRFRIMLGLNQHQFAEYTGISPRLIMAFEQGRGNPTVATLEKMLKGSGLTLSLKRKQNTKYPF